MELGVNLIEAERNRQKWVEGWSEEHDDKHVNNELALAAACYAVPDVFSQGYWPPTWDLSWYKSTTRIRDLVKAGALIAAEIDRLKRIEAKKNKEIFVPEIKELVDKAFKYFEDDGSNIIVLSTCYYTERCVVEADSPLFEISFTDDKYNKLYHPIGRNWDLGSWNCGGNKHDLQQLEYLNTTFVDPIIERLEKCDIDWFAEDYYRDDNEALNELWFGCIGIMKDYKVVSFVIRDDGMLCENNSISSHYNKIIEQL